MKIQTFTEDNGTGHDVPFDCLCFDDGTKLCDENGDYEIGISAKGNIGIGRDQDLWQFDFLPEKRAELAEYMIERWTRWRDGKL